MTTSVLDAGNVGDAVEERSKPRRFRTDIQALRALAVGLVVLNHLWPLRLPGGYVGVDVFFVISGFLISSHLLRELQATGRVRLGSFYARRARRLFPAAFLVLGASMGLAALFLPYPRWLGTAREVVASVFYAENWLLAAKSVDYSAASASASAVQHYWSLSVEEQFYLFWPLTLVLLAVIARRLRRNVVPVVAVGVLLVAALSLACCIYVTSEWPQQAYFATPVRVWEFAVGALIAVGAVQIRSLLVSNVVAVSGFGLIVISAVMYDAQTSFPGWAALLPVMGTAFVLLGGNGNQRLIHDRLSELRPVQFIGKISYSLYLWHWPLIVVSPFIFGVVPTAPYKLVVLLASVLLAWLTKTWIEDIWIRKTGRRKRISRWRDFRGPFAGMAVVSLVAVLLGVSGSVKEARTAGLTAAGAAGPCYGAAALGSRHCEDPFGMPVAVPNMGKDNEYWVVPDECLAAEESPRELGEPASCDFSDGDPNAEVVWLIGDSHAQQWQEAIMDLAEEREWLIKWTYRGACPHVDARVLKFGTSEKSDEEAEECRSWGKTVTDAIERDRPDRVFVSMFAAREVIDDGTNRSQLEQYADGLSRYWTRWVAAGVTVLPIYDAPMNEGSGRPGECLSLNPSTPLACAMPKDLALEFTPFDLAVERTDSELVIPVDLEDYFCDEQNCYSAVGGVSIYYDSDHLNGQFVTTLAPRIGELLDK